MSVLEHLRGVTKSGSGYAAFCPAHDDTNKSLTVTEAEDGRTLLFCHAGCSFAEVMEALGLRQSDAFPENAFPSATKSGNVAEFHIRDRAGNKIATHHRAKGKDGKKRMWFSTGGAKGLSGVKSSSLPLWGSEAVGAVPKTMPIVLTEGEKAALLLTRNEIPAVASVTGAAETPSKEVLEVLKGHKVVLWPDNDDEGKAHMRRIGKILSRIGADVRWYEWGANEKDDAADHPAVKRGEVENLKTELDAAPRFKPPHDPLSDGSATFEVVIDEYEKLLEMRRKSGGVTGIRTGIPQVDNNLYGLNDGYSYIIAAATNIGKSLLATQVSYTAANAGYRVLLSITEMAQVAYLDRLACYVAGVDFFRTQEGRITDEEHRDLLAAAGYISKLPFLSDPYGSMGVNRLRENIEREEPDLVVVDYLQHLKHDGLVEGRNSQVGQVSRDLSLLKQEYNIPIVVAAQLNRNLQHRGDGEPQLHDLRDSGEIEQDADVVLMLHRPDKGEVEAHEEEVKLFCRKNRMGQVFTVDLRFVKGQQWLTDDTRKRKITA